MSELEVHWAAGRSDPHDGHHHTSGVTMLSRRCHALSISKDIKTVSIALLKLF